MRLRNLTMNYWLGLSLLSALAGCGRNVTQSELIGTWEADYPAAEEKLTVLADGTFIQQVTLKTDSRVLEARGVWHFTEEDQDITFRDTFLNVLNGFGEPMKQPVPGTTILPVLRWFGKVQIGDSPNYPANDYKKVRTRLGAPGG